MIVVDSSVWISHFRDHDTESVQKLRGVRNTTRILVGDVVLLEVLQGVRNERQAGRMEGYLKKFRSASMLNAGLAVAAAANYRSLRSRGITIRKTPDLIIATYCIEHDHELLHNDRDFAPFAEHLGLKAYA